MMFILCQSRDGDTIVTSCDGMKTFRNLVFLLISKLFHKTDKMLTSDSYLKPSGNSWRLLRDHPNYDLESEISRTDQHLYF